MTKTKLKKETRRNAKLARPVMLLSIANGTGHLRAAQSIAEALRLQEASVDARLVEVSDYMTRWTRFTHLTAYSWLVKYAPSIWKQIDKYQKRQTTTSPEWFYRRGCRKLFDLTRELNPRAIVATEVGCCEIGALIKRDLQLDASLVFVATDYDVDRACIRPEVDLYCVATEEMRHELIEHGAPAERIEMWGVPVAPEFARMAKDARARGRAKQAVCDWLGLDARQPLVLVAGGGEGIGKIEPIAAQLLLENTALQLVTLSGRNERLRAKLEKMRQTSDSARARLRVLGWTDRVAELLSAADLFVSKLGVNFDEALAAELPVVALPPPVPGSEWVRYRALDEWGVGRAVQNLDELCATVETILRDEETQKKMRARCRLFRKIDAAEKIARWTLDESLDKTLDETTAYVWHSSETSELNALNLLADASV